MRGKERRELAAAAEKGVDTTTLQNIQQSAPTKQEPASVTHEMTQKASLSRETAPNKP